ncbi:MAG TPA: DUF4446 family protein [Thermoleophilaceae bacterium]|nr:DUF4446 family protein [Thermoleophilaceae bacterium]
MDGLNSTEGIVALAAAGTALVALVLAIVLAVKLRRLRAGQRRVLGDSGELDLVEHAARLEQGFIALRDWVEETAQGIERRMGEAEERIDGCVTYRSLIRYDAYGEMSGRQSSSIALLDSHRSGVVMSSILHRENARVYVKQVHEGASELELSPEEQEAVTAALERRPPQPVDSQ